MYLTVLNKWLLDQNPESHTLVSTLTQFLTVPYCDSNFRALKEAGGS